MPSDKLEFKRSPLVLGNLAVLLWSILATVAIWLTDPAMAWVFFLLAFAVLFFILRRLGCSTCAYCKSCTAGFGRIAGWYFGDRSTKDTRSKTALFFCRCCLWATWSCSDGIPDTVYRSRVRHSRDRFAGLHSRTLCFRSSNMAKENKATTKLNQRSYRSFGKLVHFRISIRNNDYFQ